MRFKKEIYPNVIENGDHWDKEMERLLNKGDKRVDGLEMLKGLQPYLNSNNYMFMYSIEITDYLNILMEIIKVQQRMIELLNTRLHN